MEIKKQIQLISVMIVFVVFFIFVVTSFSQLFYFQAYGNKESRRAERLEAESLASTSVGAVASARLDKDKEEIIEIKRDEIALGEARPRSIVFIDREGISRSNENTLRTDYISPENDEGEHHEEGEGLLALPTINIEDGTERNFVVLMFHDIVETSYVPDSTYLTKASFENILSLIKERGYETVDVQDLIDFVEGRKDLPLKSVILTFDDGYYSNYRLVYPILKREGMKAIFFPIGVSVGKRHYKDTELEMMRHYSIEEMQEMQASGLVEFGSHSYDMHQNVQLEAILGNDTPRVTIQKLETESEEDYINLFHSDLALNRELYEGTGIELLSFSCPRGGHDELSVNLLKEDGFRSIFISKTGINTVVKGRPESLYLLKRYNMSEDADYYSLLP